MYHKHEDNNHGDFDDKFDNDYGYSDDNVNLRKPEAHKALQNLMVQHAMAHKEEVVSLQKIISSLSSSMSSSLSS